MPAGGHGGLHPQAAAPLVEAFHSTLEEALCADLIVVVSDVSSPFYHQQRGTVFDVLDQLGAGGKPILERSTRPTRQISRA